MKELMNIIGNMLHDKFLFAKSDIVFAHDIYNLIKVYVAHTSIK